MSEHDFKNRTFLYENKQPNDIPEDFPNPSEIFVLMDVFHSKGGPFQRLLDCGGIRYVLALDFNKDLDSCIENELLEKMYEGFEQAEEDLNRCRRSLTLASEECMNKLWPYLKEDIQNRSENGTLMDPIRPLDIERKDAHKLQLKTIDGSVRAIEHDLHLDDRQVPYVNPYPNLRSYPKDQVEIMETLTRSLHKVRIGDDEYMFKAARFGTMRSIDKLHSAPSHPNVLNLSGVIVDEESKIMGIVTPFISGMSLWDISSATSSQKEMWKTKISEAVEFLHNENIVWGDANPDNIKISSDTNEPVLIGFEGGAQAEWIDSDLCDTMEGDLQALPRILKFVDDIPAIDV